MNLESAKLAAPFSAKLDSIQSERDGYQEMIDAGVGLDTLVIRGLRAEEVATVLNAVLAVYDARQTAAEAELVKL